MVELACRHDKAGAGSALTGVLDQSVVRLMDANAAVCHRSRSMP